MTNSTTIARRPSSFGLLTVASISRCHAALMLALAGFILPTGAALADDVVYIRPGETFSVTGVLKGGRLTDLRRVDAPEGQPNVLAFALDRKDTVTELRITSSFDGPVKYRAGVELAGAGRFIATSACTVSPGATMTELWSDPIIQLEMADFMVIDPGDPRAGVCE